jgi:cellobiose phosphorylase
MTLADTLKKFDLAQLRKDRTDRMRNPIAASIAREPFTWPGGYERFAVTDDGAVLCHKCCETEYCQIADAYPSSGWNVISQGCAAEIDCVVTCDHCNANIAECWECEAGDACNCQ